MHGDTPAIYTILVIPLLGNDSFPWTVLSSKRLLDKFVKRVHFLVESLYSFNIINDTSLKVYHLSFELLKIESRTQNIESLLVVLFKFSEITWKRLIKRLYLLLRMRL